MKYNIIQHLNISAWITGIFFIALSAGRAQELPVSKYGVHLINSVNEYRETARRDSLKKMVDLQALIPNILLDLRYAGTHNFMKQSMYPSKTNYSFLRLPAARALALVQQELNSQGYGLKIFDAYRPYSVTEKFWELVHDDRYVADPKKASGHNRGIAVDLTIIDLRTKQELTMPTGFDNFTDSAHHDFMNLPEAAIKNRKWLREIMEKYGFLPLSTEWWHYSLPDPEKYEALDLSFKTLKKAVR